MSAANEISNPKTESKWFIWIRLAIFSIAFIYVPGFFIGYYQTLPHTTDKAFRVYSESINYLVFAYGALPGLISLLLLIEFLFRKYSVQMPLRWIFLLIFTGINLALFQFWAVVAARFLLQFN